MCRTERSQSTEALFPENGESGRQGADEGIRNVCLHWDGYQVQKLGRHDPAVQVIDEITLTTLHAVLAMQLHEEFHLAGNDAEEIHQDGAWAWTFEL